MSKKYVLIQYFLEIFLTDLQIYNIRFCQIPYWNVLHLNLTTFKLDFKCPRDFVPKSSTATHWIRLSMSFLKFKCVHRLLLQTVRNWRGANSSVTHITHVRVSQINRYHFINRVRILEIIYHWVQLCRYTCNEIASDGFLVCKSIDYFR